MASVLPPLIIDGGMLEGGGQLLRNSVALSALLCKPITIQNIRNGRRPPGLKAQHEAGEHLQGATDMTDQAMSTYGRVWRRVEVGRRDLCCSDERSTQGFDRGQLLPWSHPAREEIRRRPWDSWGDRSLASSVASLSSILPTEPITLKLGRASFPT